MQHPTDLTSERYALALEAMARYGGSFASRLAKAWHCADADNAARLRAAFPDLLEKYAAMAEATGEAA